MSAPLLTFLPDVGSPARARLACWSLEPDADPLHVAASLGLAAGATLARLGLAGPDPDGHVRIRDRDVAVVAFADALPVLAATGTASTTAAPSWRRPPDSLTAWAAAAQLGLRLAAGQRVVPTLHLDSAGVVRAAWRALLDEDPSAHAAAAQIAAALPAAATAMPIAQDAVWRADRLLLAFLDAVVDHCTRTAAPPPRPGRPRARLLPWTARWVEALTDPHDPVVPLRDDAADLVAGVEGWQQLASDDAAALELRLVAPDTADGAWRLDLGLLTDEGEPMPAAAVWAATGDDAGALQDALLHGLGRCARVFPPVDAALQQATPSVVHLNLDEAWTLIGEAAPLLAGAGVVVRLPADLVSHDLRVRLHVGVEPDALRLRLLERRADATAAAADGGGLLQGAGARYHFEVALGDETLTDEDLAALAGGGSPLVRWRDRWVRLDPGAVERITRITAHGDGELDLAEALSLALEGKTAPTDFGEEDDPPVEVVAEGRIAVMVDALRDAADAPQDPGELRGFQGDLRPYQRRGVAWLGGMGDLGLGAVLADDMGLGKTVQLLVHLLRRPADRPHLVVCPTSVVGNWEREAGRFTPGIVVTRFHGTDRPVDLRGVLGLVLTTYGTLRRDVETLAAVDWDVVALDEAQFVKNPSTAGARAVRRLGGRQVVALTGTPLENRLSELWALLDATNAGLLGSQARFGRRFVGPIEKRHDRSASQRLRGLVAPFVLRRLKSDPAVIADLPDKIERTVPCPLTAEQAALYQKTLDQALASAVAAGSSMERRGRVLALLTALKQVCNHPAQYLREEAPILAGRSGKLAAAREILSAAVEGGERALVFTQYVTMGHLLVEQLTADLGAPVGFLHGGVPAGARDRLVANFQDPDGDSPVLVVSLRAGGTGLNLTAATHVLHYDRWWNPAVEDQATDRAHRIGQTRTVEVHKLVTTGTLEERIAALLDSKRALADAVVGAGESWVTELDDTDLAELVALAQDAPIADLDDDDEPLFAGGHR